MKLIVLVVCAVLGLCASAAVAQPADDSAAVAAKLAANPPADLDDYFALRERLGRSGVEAVRNAATRLAFEQLGIKIEPGRSYSSCTLPAWSQDVSAGLDLAAAVADPASWQTTKAQIEAAMAAHRQTYDRIMAGEAIPAAYAPMTANVRAAKEESQPRAREYAMRVAKDQFARLSSIAIERREL